jgi:L-ascorbate metabolism protein UlaG (beta-lactamase superfamily)
MTNKTNVKICLAMPMFFLAMAASTRAATITVGPGGAYDFDAIQAGIDAATDGDTVLVVPGEYVITESVTFRGKAVTVRSEEGPDETTIRMSETPADANGAGVVIFESGEDDGSALEGFTLTGGSDHGVYCGPHSSPTFTNCTIVGNTAPTRDGWGHSGGGVCCGPYSSPTLTNCTITGNSAHGYESSGGGVYCNWDSSPTLINCSISGNWAWQGGGVGCNSDSAATLTNCTIVGNSALHAGGMFCWVSSPTLTNCILWGNTAPRGGEISVENAGTLSLTYSNVAGGQNGVSVQGGTLNWGEGNLDADPRFADPGYWVDVNDPNIVVEPNDPNAVWIDGDYHLKSQAGRWDPNSESWVVDDVTSPCIDAGDPNSPVGDEPDPNGGVINMGAYGGTAEASMSLPVVYIQWLGHSSVKVWTDDCIVYVDPQSLSISPHDATLVCVTHTHGDHYSPSDIARVSNAETQFIAPPDVVQRYGSGQTIAPGQIIEFDSVNVTAVPSYNTNKSYHPRSRNWVGYVIELGAKRIYVAGDTDMTDEMKALEDIDAAILPAGGTYTMTATEAAEATQFMKPELAIPYHWGRNVGNLSDAETFAELARCAVQILAVGETISSDNWPQYSPLIAHLALDETEGSIAYDSAGDNDGTLHGDPAWQPAGGKIDGALRFDGTNDHIVTNFVLDPADGEFSVFAWVKGGAAGQVIVSQADGAGAGETWLGTESVDGKLMTGLVPPPAGRSVPQPLVSEFVVTDDQWHHIGLAWDGSLRRLYADGTEVATDATALAPLKSSDGGLYIGAGKTRDAPGFWSGLIDDVRIYNQALSPGEVWP